MNFSLKLWCLQYGILYCWGDLRGDTDDCKNVWRYFVWLQLCWTAYISRHNRKAFLNNDSFVMLVRWVSHLHDTSQLRQQSLEMPHSSLTDLWAVVYAEASCGSMWNVNWATQVNCTVAEEAGIYWGKKYISCWNNRFLRVHIYIYIYIYMCVCVCVCVYICVCVCIYIYTWFRTTCCYLTNKTFEFLWLARLGMPGACCSFLMFYCIHFCLYIPILSYRCC